ncbi:MAG TPA: MarR family transcriptional regulator [Streptosporangiales bacterium]
MVSDDEVVTWWGLVIEGYLATQAGLMAEIQDRCGLVPAQFDVLVRLVRTPGHRMPMTRLAKEAALSSGGFTKVADRMVDAGLIERIPSDSDRRVIHCALTDRGVDLAERARKECAEILRRRVLDPLGPDAANALAETMRTLRAANGPDGN